MDAPANRPRPRPAATTLKANVRNAFTKSRIACNGQRFEGCNFGVKPHEQQLTLAVAANRNADCTTFRCIDRLLAISRQTASVFIAHQKLFVDLDPIAQDCQNLVSPQNDLSFRYYVYLQLLHGRTSSEISKHRHYWIWPKKDFHLRGLAVQIGHLRGKSPSHFLKGLPNDACRR